jgi:molecular chaperone HtpG
VCLTSDGALSLEMEKILSAIPNDNNMKADRILEINPSHPIFVILGKLFMEDKDKLKTYSELLYTQALLIEGIAIEDPVSFSNSICELML